MTENQDRKPTAAQGREDADQPEERPATTPAEADARSEAYGGEEPPADEYSPSTDFGDG